MHFIDPRVKRSRTIPKIFTILVAIFGIVVLVQSYYLAGRAMDWRISAGVSAMVFVLIHLISRLPHERTILTIYKPSEIVMIALVTAGILALQMSGRVASEWGQSMLLETGIACLFLSAVDLLLETIQEDLKRRETEERQLWDEAALHVGMVSNLSLYSYWAMREALDEVPRQEIPTDAERARVLLRFARKAADLPDHLKIFEDPKMKALLDRDTRILELAAAYADLNHLNDDEFHYLRAIAAMRTDPDWPQPEVVTNKNLVTWIERTAEEIVLRRYTGLKRLLHGEQAGDPLDLRDEFSRWQHERFGDKLPRPNLDRTAYEGEPSDDF